MKKTKSPKKRIAVIEKRVKHKDYPNYHIV